jgi:predicted negative regulator of RcsB-dependent stress response
MARHPTARKVHRKQQQPDDIFVERVLVSAVWARQNRNRLIAGVVILAIVIGATLYWRYSSRAAAESAALALIQLRTVAQGDNPAITIRAAEDYLQQHGGTPSGDEARLVLATAQLQAGQTHAAIDALDDISDDPTDPIGISAAFLRASAHEQATALAEAEAIYTRIADRARHDFEKIRALDALARLRLEAGNPAGAIQAYDRILQLLPTNNPERPVYEMRRGEAEAIAAGG